MANAQILLPLAMPGLSASATAAGYDAAHVGLNMAGLVWRSPARGASHSLVIDLGADVAADTLFLFGVSAPGSATLLVEVATAAQGPSFGACWTGTAQALRAGAQDLVNGKAVGLWHAPSVSGPPAGRYWRLTFSALGDAAVTVSRVVLGARIELERNFVFGGGYGLKDFSAAEFSSRGVFLPRAGVRLRTLGLSFSNTRKDEVEAKVLPLLELAGHDVPVALVTDPADHEMRQRRCYFGPLVGELGSIWRNAKAWEWRADLVSLF